MAKNMTRKGLALGSIGALVIGSFVGAAPAQAADSVSLGAAFGSSAQKAATALNGIAGKTFDLVSISTNEAATRYLVEGVSAASLDVARFISATLTDGPIGSPTALTVAANLAALNTADNAGKLDVSDGDDLAVVVNPAITAGNLAQLRLGLDGITDTTTITITPFQDTTPVNGEIDSTETKGTPITLTFHKASEVTATATLKSPVIGATSVGATVTLDKDINSASIPADSVTVSFEKDGVSIDAAKAATWSTTDGFWSSTSSATTITSSTEVFSAQAKVAGATLGGNVSLGSAVVGTAATIVDGEVAFKTGANVSVDANNNAEVKAGAGSVEVSTKITAVAGKALAGQTVTYTFTRSSLRSAASITVDGKTLTRTSSPASISVEALTDADGVAKVTVDYTGFATTTTPDKVTVKSSVLGATAVIESAVEDIVAVDVKSTAIVEASAVGANAVRAIAKGGSVPVELHLVDQFGELVAAERKIQLTISGAGANVEATVIGSVVTSSGIATATVVDSSTASSGTYTLVANVQKKNTSGNWVNDEASVLNVTVVSFVMGGSAAATVSTTTAIAASSAETGYKTLQTVDMVTNDGRKLALGTAPYTAAAAADYFEITGTVRAANGVGVAGVPVTVSAAGAGFSTGGAADSVYAADSITVYTASNGSYTVWAFSNKAGKVDYTVTSGAASATTSAYFKSAALTAGKTLTIDAPAAVAPGSTLVVKATLVDKYGNPVSATKAANSVAIAYDGPGLQVSTPTDFVAGALQFGVLLGSNDSGTATITISVYLDTAKISVQKTVTVGTVGNVGDYSSWTKKLDDSSAKMYAKNVVGEGKVQFFLNGEEIAWVRAVDATDPKLRTANGSAYLVRTVEFEDGKNVLEIYVDGVRTTRTAYTK